MNRLLLTALLGLTTLAAAQSAPSPYLGANITRTYTLDDLSNKPGLIQLGKGDMVILDLPTDVTAVVTPQGAMMDIPAPLGNVVVITSKVSSGKAQLLVQLDSGRYASFALTFTPGGGGMKRVLVTDPQRIEYAQLVTQMPAYSAPNPAGEPIAIPPAPSRSVTPDPRPSATLTLKVNPAPAPLTRAQPEWLLAAAKLNATTLGDSLAVTVTNIGTRAVTFDSAAKLSVNGHDLTGSVTGNLTVGPGESRNFLVAVPEAVDGGVALDWLAFDRVANTYYHVTARQ